MSQIELSVLNRVDGSCSITSHDIDIICSVTGPIEAKSRQELPQQVALELVITPPIGPASTKEKLLEDKLRVILGRAINKYQYPRQLIQVVIQVLNNDNIMSKELKYIINSAYLALIDSGISMNSSFLATCCIMDSKGALKFEFDKAEFDASVASFLAVYDLKDGVSDELIFFESSGDDLTQDLITEVLSKAQEEINRQNVVVRKVIEDKVARDYMWRPN